MDLVYQILLKRIVVKNRTTFKVLTTNLDVSLLTLCGMNDNLCKINLARNISITRFYHIETNHNYMYVTIYKTAIYMNIFKSFNRQTGNLCEESMGAHASRNTSEAGLYSERLA